MNLGFKDAKREVINCLRSGLISHEVRDQVDSKNLFATGVISATEVEEIIIRAGGDSYTSSPHHFMGELEVHVIKTNYGGLDWYIKWYFVEPNSVFISMHN